MAVSLDDLLAPRLPEEDVTLPGVGLVRVRALSRADAVALGEAARSDEEGHGFEAYLLAATVAAPAMTVEQAAGWRRSARTGEVALVVRAANRLAALDPDAAKEAYVAFDEDPDAEFRALPGERARDDGGPHAGGDAER